MKKKILLIIPIAIIIVLLASIILMAMNYHKKISTIHPRKDVNYQQYESDNKTFMFNMLKQINEEEKNNYLISPYSINVALSMLRDGSKGDTYEQINKLIGNEKVAVINNENIKISNAMFTKNKYKSFIEETYTTNLKDNYSSEFLFDDFKTPKVINDWVNNKTDGMIPKLLDRIDEDFVLGLANAIAIDVKWQKRFECELTTEAEFTKQDGEKIKVEMMHNEYRGIDNYLESDKAKGIIIPYKEDTNLEYIAILPNDDINEYIKNFDDKELAKLESKKAEQNDKPTKIYLSIPRYTYDYDLQSFKTLLINNGMSDAFDMDKADFSGIISKETRTKNNINNLYVEEAIHKTHIALNEEGTKAAAVTFFGLNEATAFIEPDYNIINIDLNKPFIYMIREKTTNSILFLGVVNEPNKWNGTTCGKR